MNLEDVLETIDSPRFAAELNVASDWNTFGRLLYEHWAVQRLDTLLITKGNREAVFRFLRHLAQREVDPRYENRWDVALCAYLAVLARHDKTLGALAAQAVGRTAQCWWAPRVAARVLSSDYQSGGGNQVSPIIRAAISVASREHDARDRLIRPDVLRFANASTVLSATSTRSAVTERGVKTHRFGQLALPVLHANESTNQETQPV